MVKPSILHSRLVRRRREPRPRVVGLTVDGRRLLLRVSDACVRREDLFGWVIDRRAVEMESDPAARRYLLWLLDGGLRSPAPLPGNHGLPPLSESFERGRRAGEAFRRMCGEGGG